MGRLKVLEIDNFKSYAGSQVSLALASSEAPNPHSLFCSTVSKTVGPFKQFQAVIGPNGAGKSNLMDAISFVLGVKSRHLRSSKMSDLVFRASGGAPSSKRRASVKAIYEVSDDEVEGLEVCAKVFSLSHQSLAPQALKAQSL